MLQTVDYVKIIAHSTQRQRQSTINTSLKLHVALWLPK